MTATPPSPEALAAEATRLAREEGYRAGLAAGLAQRQEQFVCPDCDPPRVFATLAALNGHSGVHQRPAPPAPSPPREDPRFFCEQCDPPRPFLSAQALGGHRKSHTVEVRAAVTRTRAEAIVGRPSRSTVAAPAVPDQAPGGVTPGGGSTVQSPQERPAIPGAWVPTDWKSRFCHSGAHRRCTLFAERCTCSCHTDL